MADRSKPFVGIEAEGPRKGERTLFVPGSTPPVTLAQICSTLKSNRPRFVYYGAGNDRKWRNDTFGVIRSVWEPEHITIEVENYYDIPKKSQDPMILVVSLDPYDVIFKTGCWHKRIYHTSIEWFKPQGGEPITTSLFDPLFSKDENV